ncbi:transposable element Tcb2 transposase [Trichonephila clavipes]|nr:transposable element Tcb2 transposase [Trichonephila clavipes]
MDDNARPHRTLAVEELLECEDITRKDWPAYSLDLNPIELVWDTLGIRIAARLHHPENTQQLKQMLIEEWVLLPQEMLHQLVLSMRRRCEATIAFDRGRIVAYRDWGLSFREIGSRVGRNQTTVKRICDRRMQDATTDRSGQSHPPQCTTSREYRHILCMSVKNRSVTSRTLAQHIESVTHHSVSARTIRRS